MPRDLGRVPAAGARFYYGPWEWQQVMAAYPTISDNPQIQQSYVSMRKAGQSHNVAEMLANQTPPGDWRSDRTFMALNQFNDNPAEGLRLKKKAERAGVSVPEGAIYMSGLARYRGDPQAWVRGIDDVRRAASKRPLRAELAGGDVLVDTLSSYESPPVDLDRVGPAKKILDRETKQHEDAIGQPLRGKERKDFRQKLFDRRKGTRSKAVYQGQ